jgi:hypothetical protein
MWFYSDKAQGIDIIKRYFWKPVRNVETKQMFYFYKRIIFLNSTSNIIDVEAIGRAKDQKYTHFSKCEFLCYKNKMGDFSRVLLLVVF